MRWALIDAVQHVPAGHPLRKRKEDILSRRGSGAKNIANVAMARQLLTWVYYAMRDGQVRDWPPPPRRPGQQARTRAARDRWSYWPPPPRWLAAGLIDPVACSAHAPCPAATSRGPPEG